MLDLLVVGLLVAILVVLLRRLPVPADAGRKGAGEGKMRDRLVCAGITTIILVGLMVLLSSIFALSLGSILTLGS